MHATSEDVCVGLLDRLQSVLGSAEFQARHRQRPADFTRDRSLTFKVVVLFLINLIKRSLQDELDEFFKLMEGEELAVRRVTKGAWTHARKKLKYQAFVELNQEQVSYSYQHGEPFDWHGFRLLAIDGSTARLPNTEALCKHFGVWRPAAGGQCPKARVSQLFDVLNQVTIDALILPKAIGERAAAAQHCVRLSARDLVLLDRGYPAFWLFALIASQGAHFCARMTGSWLVVRTFLASGQKEQIVTLEPSAASRKECQARGLPGDPIQVRLLRIELENGEVVVLATSLLDTDRHPHALFADLYRLRWPVEEDYKVMKSRIQVENWTGKTVHAIYQDFHARVFSKNLAALLAPPAQAHVQEQTATRKYRYQINRTHLLSKLKDTLVLLLREPDRLRERLQQLWQLVSDTLEPVRPGRSVPRRKRVKPPRFSMAYKPTR